MNNVLNCFGEFNKQTGSESVQVDKIPRFVRKRFVSAKHDCL